MMPPTSRVWPLLWPLAGVLALLCTLVHGGGPHLDNDSFQYLSVARNLLEGHGISTSLVYFDEHQVSGAMPAPQTVFPPGYPLLIAALGWLGVPLETAGVIVSAAAYLLLIPVFLWGGRLLQVNGLVLNLLLLFLVSNSAGWFYGVSVLAESLFTTITLLALVLLMRAEMPGPGAEPHTRRALLGGAVLAGFSYWVRHAGLFLIAAAGLYYLAKFLTQRTGKTLRDLLLFGGVTLAVASVVLLRNVRLSGSFQGGNTKQVDNPVAALLSDFGSSVWRLGLGYNTTPSDLYTPDIFGPATFLSLLVLVFLLVLHLLVHQAALTQQLRRPPVLLAVCYVVVYTAAMFYCGKYTVISFHDPRMFYPLVPVVLLVFASTCPQSLPEFLGARHPQWLMAALLLSAGVYSLVHLRSLLRQPPEALHDAAAVLAGERLTAQESLQQWLDSHVASTETVLATDGQAFGYLFDRPTVGLASLLYSAEPWTEDRLQRAASTYGATFLIVFPYTKDTAQIAQESPFLQTLLDGRLPGWIRLEAQNDNTKIYHLDPW